MDKLSLYSGECHMGDCGDRAHFNDWRGKPLHVGDIVMVFTVRQSGNDFDYLPNYPTAIVQDDDGIWVMGLKGISLRDPDFDGNRWRVMKIKGYEEVISGERWEAYGFNYRTAIARATLSTSTGKEGA